MLRDFQDLVKRLWGSSTGQVSCFLSCCAARQETICSTIFQEKLNETLLNDLMAHAAWCIVISSHWKEASSAFPKTDFLWEFMQGDPSPRGLDWVDLDLGCSTVLLGQHHSCTTAQWPVEHPKSKPTQPRSARRWVTLYYLIDSIYYFFA